MAVSDRLATLVALVAVLGCTGNPGPQLGTTPTEAAREIADTKAAAGATEGPVAAEAPAQGDDPESSEPAPAEPESPKGEFTRESSMVLREGEQFESARVTETEDEQPSLWEAAQAEQRRRQETGPSQVVITDANLHEYARGGQLTELVTEPLPPSAEESTGTGLDEEVYSEEYWRERIRNARLGWRAAADRVSELEARVAKLRYDFYAQDDPFYRDSQIKPAWDRAALELERAKSQVEEKRLEVQIALQAGHREGALPGWLREGLEFEPEVPEGESRPAEGELSTVEAIDAPVVEEPPS